jgi:SAM-dependent methyltransferase
MFDAFRYDFGYNFWVAYGHVVPLTIFGLLAALAVWQGWRWMAVLCGGGAAWSVFGLVVTHALFHINSPAPLPTERFLAAGTGHVLDAGAGSGRGAIGLALARPKVTVTALDIYQGNYGIDDNTPEHLMKNARIAGVADRVDARRGDMRDMPFAPATFDAAISIAAIDHLRHEGIVRSLAEVSRVLKPGGEFLLEIVRVDLWSWLASPHAMAHHRTQNPEEWRSMLGAAGMDVLEQGTQPATWYFLARKVR